MGTFDQSSSPLTTLFPQTSPYKMPDYASQLNNWQQTLLNNTRLQLGLYLSSSSNTATALNGKNMVNDSIYKPNQSTWFPQTSTSTNSNSNSNSSGLDWNQGFEAVNKLGNLIGGTAGNILSNGSKLGSSIKMITDASKGLKSGAEGASKSMAGGIGAAVGAASDMIGSFMPLKTEYEGDKGDITLTMDSVYDGISDAAMSFGPIGCVCAGSRVINNLGKFLNIEDLTKDEGIIGWGNKTINKEQIFALKEPQYKECLRITLQSGWFLECSTDHPILYSHKGRAERINIDGKRIRVRQWKFRKAEELLVGDNVGIVNEIPIWGNLDMWNPYLIGMLIGDGTYGKDHEVRMFSADSDIWKYLEDNNLGVRINFNDSEYNKEFRAYRIINGPKYLRELGIYEQTKLNKRLPNNIHLYTKDSICLLIAGLIDTDGCVLCNSNTKEYKIIFYLKNKILIDLIREQLLKLGIHCSVQKTNKREGLIGNRTVHTNDGYKLIIKDKLSLVTFYNNIRLNISYKLNTLEDIYNQCIKGSVKDNRLLSGAKADKIIKIEPIGLKLVYNLLADDDHTYIANGLITHNTLVGGIMKGGAMLGKGMNALGGGTDGMTTTDAILGSSFFNLTPIGLINGFGGSKTQTFTKDDDAFAQVGTSYTGSESDINDAVHKAGKKYGLFSSKARLSADRKIDEAKRLQGIILDISSTALDLNNLRTSMSAINGNRRALQMQGGYDLAAIRVGRHGMSIDLLLRARNILKAQHGVKLPYKVWVKDVNPNFLSKYYDLETAYNYLPIEQLNRWKKAVNSKNPDYYMNYKDKNGNYPYHLDSVAPIEGTEDYIFLKKGTEKENPELHFETDTYYNGSNGLKNTHDLVYEGDRYYYRKKKSTPKHQNGGSIITIVKESIILLVNPNDVPEFKNGGSVNVIPDGALHARKHNMNLDGITEKGIPVVSDGENGEIKLQAEVEKEEVIFRLEVTLKLEELEKKYYSDETSLKEKDEYALEAGKLIIKELLHNTKDNAGLL